MRAIHEEERDVGAETRCDPEQLLARERLLECLVGKPESSRCIGAAAAEPGGDRDRLLDPYPPLRLDACPPGELLERGANQRVVGKAFDSERGCVVELDPVDEVDPLQDRQNLVLAVVADRPDDEREIDLRGGRRSHSNALVSATKSAGASASARTSAF